MSKLLPFVILWIAAQLVKFIPDEIGPDNPPMKKLYIYEVWWDNNEAIENAQCQVMLATDILNAVELAEAAKPEGNTEITKIERWGFADVIQKLPEGEGPYR